MINVTVSGDMESQLRSVAHETGGSIDDLVKEALMYFLVERKLDRQDVESARLALEEYEQEGGGITLDELVCKLGIQV